MRRVQFINDNNDGWVETVTFSRMGSTGHVNVLLCNDEEGENFHANTVFDLSPEDVTELIKWLKEKS